MVSHKSDNLVYDAERGSGCEDKPFEPPPNFKKIACPAPNTSTDNKEIWLIKTPRGFPVSELKTLPVSVTATEVKNDGVKSFPVENSDFQVSEDHFWADRAKYHIVNGGLLNKKIDRFFTVREVVRLPEIDYSVVVDSRKDVAKAENLRMRHFASGYAAKDFKEAHPIPESRLDAGGKVTKRTRTDLGGGEEVDDGDSSEIAVKREKKSKKEKKKKKDQENQKEKRKKKAKRDE